MSGANNTGLRFQPGQHEWLASVRRNLHGQRRERRIDTNRSNADRKKCAMENGTVPVTWTTLPIGRYAPGGFGQRERTFFHAFLPVQTFRLTFRAAAVQPCYAGYWVPKDHSPRIATHVSGAACAHDGWMDS